ncbi:MAG: fumarylacetoacetate hydrolase family protein, partial [Bryobacteraceae bacterium]
PGGVILGYTIGNDMSSRDIEGENPLYLPQAKTYDKCCALGPAVFVSPDPLSPETNISLSISRAGKSVFAASTTLAAMKRKPTELVEFVYRESSFPDGCYLLTGTGVIPPDEFTLSPGDFIEMSIDGIGVLTNTVERL